MGSTQLQASIAFPSTPSELVGAVRSLTPAGVQDDIVVSVWRRPSPCSRSNRKARSTTNPNKDRTSSCSADAVDGIHPAADIDAFPSTPSELEGPYTPSLPPEFRMTSW